MDLLQIWIFMHRFSLDLKCNQQLLQLNKIRCKDFSSINTWLQHLILRIFFYWRLLFPVIHLMGHILHLFCCCKYKWKVSILASCFFYDDPCYFPVNLHCIVAFPIWEYYNYERKCTKRNHFICVWKTTLTTNIVS